ncbi:MAG: ATP-binding protein [Candidatus Omnitrophica bacterium]|nr:ATP-binding protein [Candidatus Omnitrophota bacterium]
MAAKEENFKIRTTIPNDSSLLKEVSKKLIARLEERHIDDNIIFDIHVGVEEAIRNAMVHGNQSDPDKKVTIIAEIADNKVMITVEDEGNGFNPDNLPDPTLDENLLKEGGRGVYLIKHLMDEVRYENGGRRIIMIKCLKKNIHNG